MRMGQIAHGRPCAPALHCLGLGRSCAPPRFAGPKQNRINRAAQEHGSDSCALTEAHLSAVRESVLADQLSRFDADVAKAAVDDASGLLGGIDFTDPCEAAKAVNRTLAVLGAVTNGRDPDYIRKSIAMMSSSTYSGAIVKRYQGRRMTYMALLELLSFGPLVGFYKQCFKKGGRMLPVRQVAP